MRTRAIGLVTGAVVVAATLLVTMSPVVVAGGGVCHDPQTLDRTGTAVDLKDFCMWPTVVRVGVGKSVTWTNRDDAMHTVTGAGGSWGTWDPFSQGESVTYRFDTAGVFPYFCALHPGMVGAVVVGNGGAAQTADDAAAGVVAATSEPSAGAPSAIAATAPPVPVSAAPVAAAVQNQPSPNPSSAAGLPPIAAAGLLLLVLLAGLGTGYVLARDRRSARLATDRGSDRGT